MKWTCFIFLTMLVVACQSDAEPKADEETAPDIVDNSIFDQDKWMTVEDGEYPYRDQMVHDVLYNDTIRDLSKDQLTELLGEPNDVREGHLYYSISRSNLGGWTLSAKTLVVKLVGDSSIAWIKLHGD